MKIFPIDSINDIVLALKIIDWIYFPLIKPSQLYRVTSRGGQPLNPPLALLEAPKALKLALGQFLHPPRPIFNLRIWLYIINSLIGKLSVTHWPVIGGAI